MDINWLDKSADWAFWIITAGVAFVYNWLNVKINKSDERLAHTELRIVNIEKQRLEDKLENVKIFVDKDDLFKLETKVDKVFDSIEELKDKLLLKP